MAALLTSLTTFFEWCLGNLIDILETVTAQPALLILVIAMPIVGFAFGLLHRLIRM